MHTATITNRRRKNSFILFLFLILAVVSFPSAYAEGGIQEVVESDVAPSIEEEAIDEAAIAAAEEEIEEAIAAAEQAAAEQAIDEQAAADQTALEDALAEQAAADEKASDDDADAEEEAAAVDATDTGFVTKITTFTKGLTVTKQNIKKAAAGTLGIWGAATGFGWAMNHFGSGKSVDH